MAEMKLIALYPHPTDIEEFERDYQAHLALFHEKMHVPTHERSYTVTHMVGA